MMGEAGTGKQAESATIIIKRSYVRAFWECRPTQDLPYWGSESMKSALPTCWCAASLLLIGACAKQDNQPSKAALAVNGLMPGGQPQFESVYVADQSQIKTLPPPAAAINDDSLETIRATKQAAAEPAAKPAADVPASAEEAPEAGDTKDAKSSSKKVGGLIGALGEKLKSASKPEKKTAPAKTEAAPSLAAKKPAAAKPKAKEAKEEEQSDDEGAKAKDAKEPAGGEKAEENGDKPDEEKAEGTEGSEDREGRDAEKTEGDQEKKDEGGGGNDRGGG